MLSPSPLKPTAVPSSSLLRFLRSQSDYFTANSSSSPSLRSKSSTPRGKTSKPRQCSARGAWWTLRGSSWTHLAPAPCRATVEASCFWTLPSSSSSSSPRRGTGSDKFVRLSELSPFRGSGARALSTKGRPLLRRLFDFKKNKAAEAAKASRTSSPALIDDGTETSFNIGRGLVSKATNELRLRCTEFDKNGNVTLVNGEFRKSELIAKVCFCFFFFLCECGLEILTTTVWSSSSRSSKNRFFDSSTHSCPAERDSHQPVAFEGIDQSRPGTCF